MVQLPTLILIACLCAAPLANAKVSSLKRTKRELTSSSRDLKEVVINEIIIGDDLSNCDYSTDSGCTDYKFCDDDGGVCKNSCSDDDEFEDGCNNYSECDGYGTCVPKESDYGCSDYASESGCPDDRKCNDGTCTYVYRGPLSTPSPTPAPTPTVTPAGNSGVANRSQRVVYITALVAAMLGIFA